MSNHDHICMNVHDIQATYSGRQLSPVSATDCLHIPCFWQLATFLFSFLQRLLLESPWIPVTRQYLSFRPQEYTQIKLESLVLVGASPWWWWCRTSSRDDIRICTASLASGGVSWTSSRHNFPHFRGGNALFHSHSKPHHHQWQRGKWKLEDLRVWDRNDCRKFAHLMNKCNYSAIRKSRKSVLPWEIKSRQHNHIFPFGGRLLNGTVCFCLTLVVNSHGKRLSRQDKVLSK